MLLMDLGVSPIGDSRLGGGATPEPGKEEEVCSLVSVETDPHDSL